jgi:hypothetical protein
MSKQKDEEIERVFKVRQVPKNITQYPSENIVQGYLAIDVTGAEVRLRKIGIAISRLIRARGAYNAENWKSN